LYSNKSTLAGFHSPWTENNRSLGSACLQAGCSYTVYNQPQTVECFRCFSKTRQKIKLRTFLAYYSLHTLTAAFYLDDEKSRTKR